MKFAPRRRLFGAVALSLSLAAPLACDKTRADTKNPDDERGGAGADGNNSAPESLSNGGPDPDKTDITEPSTNPQPPGDASSPPPADSPSTPPPK